MCEVSGLLRNSYLSLIEDYNLRGSVDDSVLTRNAEPGPAWYGASDSSLPRYRLLLSTILSVRIKSSVTILTAAHVA